MARHRLAHRDLKDIQGNILRGYGRRLPEVAYLFARVDDKRVPSARKRLAAWAADVADARPWRGSDPTERIGLAFTHPGLGALGVPTEPWDRFEDFRQGMRARAVSALGDDQKEVDGWPADLADQAHLLLTVYAADENTLRHAVNARTAALDAAGLHVLYTQRAGLTTGDREPFGFRDGFSQPVTAVARKSPHTNRAAVRGEGAQSAIWPALLPSPGDPREVWRGLRGGWRELAPGEFLLGHPDEDGPAPENLSPWLHNGTFMVWRKLEQDVTAFREWKDWIGRDPGGGEDLAAWVVGRRTNGRSLMEPEGDAPADPDNTFLYSADPDGRRCPIGAHVRRAYPRDALGARTERTRRNRIIRRGVPYQEPDAEGLIFVCFNASITRQFEQIQGQWLARGDALGLGDEPDFLTGGMGKRDAVTMIVPSTAGRPTRILSRRASFVTPRGGYYLFVPGRRALSAMLG